MRYAAGLFYALAIAAHSGALLNSLMLGGLIFAGTVATLFAVEGIIKDALTQRESRTRGKRRAF